MSIWVGRSLYLLTNRGFCAGPRDCFDRLVAPLPTEWPAFPRPTNAVATIREAGGAPIVVSACTREAVDRPFVTGSGWRIKRASHRRA